MDEQMRETPPEASEHETKMAERAALEARMKSGAHWFYWLAALSVVNSIVAAVGGGWAFIFGLGFTQVIDAFAAELGFGTAMILAEAVVIGVFLLFGFAAAKGKMAAFWIGMAVYLVDGLIFVLVGDWLSVGFHVFALFGIFSGARALSQLRAIKVDPFEASHIPA